MSKFRSSDTRQRLVQHVQALERLEHAKDLAVADLREAFAEAKLVGFDTTTLKVVLKLRKMTPEQRKERRALEAIYLAALGMLEGDPLTDEARRRLDGQEEPATKPATEDGKAGSPASPAAEAKKPVREIQPTLALKLPEEARKEGSAAAAAGKRIYDNPYPAGDPCRAAWDEGWCAKSKSHGMDTPSAFQRRSTKPSEKKGDKDHRDDGDGDGEKKDVA